MNNKKYILWGILILLVLPTLFAYPIFLKPLDSNNITQPDTSFAYTFNFTTNFDCSGVLLSKSQVLKTGPDGIAFIDINTSSISAKPNYICEYRNGTLKHITFFSDQFFDRIFATSLNLSGNAAVNGSVNVTKNVTASWFKGLFNWVTGDDWHSFNGSTLLFNESKLSNNYFHKNENLNNSGYNITASNFFGKWEDYTPTTLGSWLETTFGWINNTVNNLANYFTKTESDDRYVNIDGDTMTGNLTLNDSYLKLTNSSTTWDMYVNGDGTLVWEVE